MIAGSFFAASSCIAQAAPENKAPQTTWADELDNKYPGLLAEWGRLFEKLQKNVKFPASREESQLLPLLPESTIAYGAIPNYGDTSHQALKVFQQELQESDVLRDWWQHGGMATAGPKLEDSVEKFYQVSQYLGDEVVVSAAMDGKEPRMLIVAEIKKPGLKLVFQQMEKEFAGKSKSGVRVVDPKELASLESKRPADELLLLVRPDYVVGATDLPTLRNFNARLDRGTRGFATTSFGQRIAQAYQGGITLVAAANMHKTAGPSGTWLQTGSSSVSANGICGYEIPCWGSHECGRAGSE